MDFRDIVVGWPGSVHDSRVLRTSSLYATTAVKFPGDTHLLGDGGYPLKRYQFDFSIRENRGNGVWKFNNSLLRDNKFVHSMEEKIPFWREEHENDNTWEFSPIQNSKILLVIPKKRLKIAVKRNKDYQELNEAEKLLGNVSSEENKTMRIKEQVELFEREKTNGTIFRSIAKWQEGEKNTKYFLSLEKINYKKKNMYKYNRFINLLIDVFIQILF